MTSKMTLEKCNELRSEELCGSGRKFQLSWKAKYNWIEYNTDKRRQLVQMLSSCKCALREDSYATFVRRLKSYLRSMTQERLNHIAVTSCHSEKLDSNKLLDEFIKKAPVRMNVFSFYNAT